MMHVKGWARLDRTESWSSADAGRSVSHLRTRYPGESARMQSAWARR